MEFPYSSDDEPLMSYEEYKHTPYIDPSSVKRLWQEHFDRPDGRNQNCEVTRAFEMKCSLYQFMYPELSDEEVRTRVITEIGVKAKNRSGEDMPESWAGTTCQTVKKETKRKRGLSQTEKEMEEIYPETTEENKKIKTLEETSCIYEIRIKDNLENWKIWKVVENPTKSDVEKNNSFNDISQKFSKASLNEEEINTSSDLPKTIKQTSFDFDFVENAPSKITENKKLKTLAKPLKKSLKKAKHQKENVKKNLKLRTSVSEKENPKNEAKALILKKIKIPYKVPLKEKQNLNCVKVKNLSQQANNKHITVTTVINKLEKELATS